MIKILQFCITLILRRASKSPYAVIEHIHACSFESVPRQMNEMYYELFELRLNDIFSFIPCLNALRKRTSVNCNQLCAHQCTFYRSAYFTLLYEKVV